MSGAVDDDTGDVDMAKRPRFCITVENCLSFLTTSKCEIFFTNNKRRNPFLPCNFIEEFALSFGKLTSSCFTTNLYRIISDNERIPDTHTFFTEIETIDQLLEDLKKAVDRSNVGRFGHPGMLYDFTFPNGIVASTPTAPRHPRAQIGGRGDFFQGNDGSRTRDPYRGYAGNSPGGSTRGLLDNIPGEQAATLFTVQRGSFGSIIWPFLSSRNRRGNIVEGYLCGRAHTVQYQCTNRNCRNLHVRDWSDLDPSGQRQLESLCVEFPALQLIRSGNNVRHNNHRDQNHGYYNRPYDRNDGRGNDRGRGGYRESGERGRGFRGRGGRGRGGRY